jgi:hypothetical protein
MLRVLLKRRQSTQISTASATPPAASTTFDTEGDSSIISVAPPEGTSSSETIYGDRTLDQGDEVRFSVELTRIDRLEDTLSLDIRRLKGNLRSYKFLYDTLRECVFFIVVSATAFAFVLIVSLFSADAVTSGGSAVPRPLLGLVVVTIHTWTRNTRTYRSSISLTQVKIPKSLGSFFYIPTPTFMPMVKLWFSSVVPPSCYSKGYIFR